MQTLPNIVSRMSFTIPARLARTAQVSASPSDARRRALQLYRSWLRSTPEILMLYALNVSPTYFRHAIRQRFERNRYVTDPRAIDFLLLKEYQDYQETMNMWKQTDHIMQMLEPDVREERHQMTFLQKFFEGRDEHAVIPAASGTR